MTIFWQTIDYIPSFGGALVAIVLIVLLAVFAVNKNNWFAVLFWQAYEWMLDFFGDILWEYEFVWIKSFITNMFFVIWFYNLLWLLFDFLWPITWFDTIAEEFHLAKYIGFGTSDYHFTIAMAVVGVLIMLVIQFIAMSGDSFMWKQFGKHSWATPVLKVGNFLYEYVPFWGKNIITIEKGTMSPFLYYPLWSIVKIFDIIISLFVGALDIVGVFAKVISLAFRLFGNMLSGTALLTVLVLWLSSATKNWFGVEFPILAPLILVLQGLLVASIQAFVFPLLIAIFIKVARWVEDEATT